MPRTISGLLIDIEGVLVSGNNRLAGSLETLNFLNKKRIPFLLVSNITRMSRLTIWHHLVRLGFPITENHILTPSLAAINWLKKQKVEKIALFLSGSSTNDFKQFKITSANPEYLVIGNLAQDLTFDKLNQAYRLLMKGAKMLALQKNRYWQSSDGLTIDAGAIVAALEFASKKRALVIGKPQKSYFLEAADIIGIPINKLAVIGDDLEVDIKGGQAAGLFPIAVKTGNFREDIYKKGKIKPSVVLNSIEGLPNYLKNYWGDLK